MLTSPGTAPIRWLAGSLNLAGEQGEIRMLQTKLAPLARANTS
jgi:hypothetical protein